MGLVIGRWRDVVGCEGDYQVSDLGNVRSIDGIIIRSNGSSYKRRGKLLRAFPNHSGHLSIMLGTRFGPRKYVHTLVLEAFVGLRPLGAECRHLDGNPANNRVENLCWGSHSENIRDVFDRHGGRVDTRLSPEAAKAVREVLSKGARIIDVANAFGVSHSCISAVKFCRAW